MLTGLSCIEVKFFEVIDYFFKLMIQRVKFKFQLVIIVKVLF